MRCQTTHRADRIAAALVLLSVLSKFYAFTRLAFTVHCTALGIGRLGIWGEGGAACSRCSDFERLREEERVSSIERERRDSTPDDDDVARAVN